jgi:hypothetical protein
MFCHKCGAEIPVKDKIGRQEYCSQCDAALHCCMNCRFYSPGAYHDCKETEAEWVSDKAGSNFCDTFSPCEKKTAAIDQSAEARRKLDRLFGK